MIDQLIHLWQFEYDTDRRAHRSVERDHPLFTAPPRKIPLDSSLSRRTGPAGLEKHPEWGDRHGCETVIRAPAILDLTRLLDEHAAAVPAAASKRLEEVNQLAHHRRLVLQVGWIEPLEDIDGPALEIEQGQNLGVWHRRLALLYLLAEIELEIKLSHRHHVRQCVRHGIPGVGGDPRQERNHERLHESFPGSNARRGIR